jgi:hypothetical protein
MRPDRAFQRTSFLLLAAMLCVTACLPLPYRSSEWASTPAGAETLKVGDEVRIKNKNTGKHYLFTVHELTDDGFIGRHENDTTYRVRYTDLASLEVKRGEWHVFLLPLSGQVKGGGVNWGFLVVLSVAALLRRRGAAEAAPQLLNDAQKRCSAMRAAST